MGRRTRRWLPDGGRGGCGRCQTEKDEEGWEEDRSMKRGGEGEKRKKELGEELGEKGILVKKLIFLF